MAEQQRAKPDRIRWFASLPFQYADDAKAELARCVKAGAVGVMVIANIDGEDLTNPKFAPVWAEIDKLGWPVLVHPGAPQGVREQHMDEFNMIPPVGFMCDTTLAFTRMIYSGFLDKYPNIKLIASHGGATLPYLAGRLDRCWEMIPGCSEVIKDKPSDLSAAHLVRHRGLRPARARSLHLGRGLERIACSTARTIRTISATWWDASRASTRCRPIRRSGCGERRRGSCSSCDAVIPGPAEGRSPESIATSGPMVTRWLRDAARGYGFRARRFAAPRNDVTPSPSRPAPLRDPHQVEHHRRAGIEPDVQEDLADLLARDAVGDGATDMTAQFVLAVQDRQHRQIEHAARLAVEAFAPPHRAPPCSVMKSWIGLPMSSWFAASARST